MGYNIVTESAYKMREIARQALKGYWKPVVAACLMYFILTAGVTYFLDYFFTYNYPVQAAEGQVVSASIGFGGSLYSFILGGPLQFGLTMFMVVFFRTRRCDNTLLFEGFSNFSRTFVLAFLMGVKIILWSMLFIIPGIIASFKYSQAYYILVDNPTWSPSKCIRESCRIMNGNKYKLFCLEFSFIGWGILASLPEAIYTVAARDSLTSIGGIIVMILLGLPGLYVTAYSMVAKTAFYELVTEKLVVVPEVAETTGADEL